ncbi:MAG: recombinase family protein [Pyrinomonadaceae bacterium]
MSNKKYYSYIRVSTQRQGQHGTSLTEQQAAIDRFAKSWNLPIVERFEERETAAKQGRPVFLEMLKRLKRGSANGVIIHKIDRSARNLKDWADLGSLIDSGLEVHFASESLDLNSRGGRLSADIQAVVASDYVRNLREEAKKGIYGRLKQGIFPFQAPVGFLDCGPGKPKSIDPVAGPLIRTAFELYATGRWGLRALPEELHRLGLRNRNGKNVTTNGLFTILHNPFYMGLIRIQKTGDVFAGAHTPIVSKRLFDHVQDIFAGKTVPKRTIHNFTYRRMIRCSTCEHFLIGELQKRMVYYRCQTRGCTSACLKEETVTETLGRDLKRLELGPQEFRLYRDESIKLFEDRNNESENAKKELVLHQKKIKDRRGRLVDSYLDGILDKEDYVERKSQLIAEELDLKDRIGRLDKNWNDIPTRFEEFLELANSAYLSFISAPVDLKREMLKIVTSNFTADGKTVSIKLENTFEMLAARPPFPGGRAHPNMARTVSAYLSRFLKVFIENDYWGESKTVDLVAQKS